MVEKWASKMVQICVRRLMRENFLPHEHLDALFWESQKGPKRSLENKLKFEALFKPQEAPTAGGGTGGKRAAPVGGDFWGVYLR